MDPIYWSVALLVLGILLLILELFVPSGGVLGLLAGASVVASIVVAFSAGPIQGMVMMLVALIMLPLVVTGALKVWPHTPIGKRMLVQSPRAEDVVLVNEEFQRLIGKRGVAATKMLPSGSVRVDNKSYDAVSTGMPIDEGEGVQVIRVSGNHIVVQPFDGPFEEFPQEAGEFFPPPHNDFETDDV